MLQLQLHTFIIIACVAIQGGIILLKCGYFYPSPSLNLLFFSFSPSLLLPSIFFFFVYRLLHTGRHACSLTYNDLKDPNFPVYTLLPLTQEYFLLSISRIHNREKIDVISEEYMNIILDQWTAATWRKDSICDSLAKFQFVHEL